MAWFGQLDSEVLAAIISGIVAIVVALMGIVQAVISNRKKKEPQNAISVTQTISGNNNTVVGVQNNKEKD